MGGKCEFLAPHLLVSWGRRNYKCSGGPRALSRQDAPAMAGRCTSVAPNFVPSRVFACAPVPVLSPPPRLVGAGIPHEVAPAAVDSPRHKECARITAFSGPLQGSAAGIVPVPVTLPALTAPRFATADAISVRTPVHYHGFVPASCMLQPTTHYGILLPLPAVEVEGAVDVRETLSSAVRAPPVVPVIQEVTAQRARPPTQPIAAAKRPAAPHCPAPKSD